MNHDPVEVSRLLTGAAKAIANVRYCWLETVEATGGVTARPMGQLPRAADEDGWLIRFITDGRSRKANDVRRADKVALIFQSEADDAYAKLTGGAKLREDASKDRHHWKEAYGVYFPTEQDLANAAFIEIETTRMELWIRGVTPEPFGLRPTVLERQSGDAWRLIS